MCKPVLVYHQQDCLPVPLFGIACGGLYKEKAADNSSNPVRNLKPGVDKNFKQKENAKEDCERYAVFPPNAWLIEYFVFLF
jgi:hypothetical protein